MSHCKGYFPVEGFVRADIVDMGKVARRGKPDFGWSTAAVEEDLGVRFEPSNGPIFSRVLPGVMGFGIFVSNEVLPIEFLEMTASLNLGVVAAKVGGCPFMAEEIGICLRGLAFGAEPVDVDDVRVHAVKDLGTGGSGDIATVGKKCICRHFLPKSWPVELRKSGSDVLA